MPRIRVKLREMKDASVRFISLVDRAASRMPVRVMKREDPQEPQMIDLSNPMSLFKRLTQKSETAPAVSALVIPDQGDDHTAKVAAVLKDQGFNVETVVKNEDGTVMFSQVDDPLDAAQMVRMSDNLLIVVKGGDLPVGELGFLPGLDASFSLLGMTVREALLGGTPADEVASVVKEAVSKFEKDTMALVSAIPQSVFKADSTISELEVQTLEADNQSATNTEEVVEKADAAKFQKPDDVEQEKWDAMDDETKEAVCKGCDSKEKETPKEEKEEAKKAETDPQVAEVASMVSTLAESLKTLVSKMDDLGTKVDGISSAQKASELRVDEAVKKADTAARALETVIVAPAGKEDTPANSREVTKKSEDNGIGTGYFDSAFSRRRTR